MRRILALLLVLALALPAAAQVSLLGLRNSLVEFALRQISVPGELEIAAAGVEDAEDGATELVGVTVADGGGVWLRIERLSLRWNPRRIVRGELEIGRLAATGVAVLRAPAASAVAVAAKPGSELAAAPPRGLLDWPRAPIATRIERLELNRVTVAPGAIAAEGLAFDAVGALRDEGDEQSASLALDRTDRVAGRIALEYRRDFAADRLDLALEADEAPGGLVAALAGLPAGAASRVRLSASGPLADWSARFEVEAEGVIAARGAGRLDATGRLAAAADLVVAPGPAAAAVLGPAVAAALAPEARLRFDLAEDDAGRVTIREAALRAADLGLDATGTYDRPGAVADLALRLEAGAGLAALADGVAFDRIGFDGFARGPLDDLVAEGRLALAGLRTAPLDIAAADLAATIRRGGARLSLDLAGAAEGLRLDRLGPDLLGRAELALAAALEGEAVTLSRLRIAARPIEVSVEGAADLASGTADLAYRLAAPDLAPLAAAYGAEAAGRIEAEGRIEGPFAAPRLFGSLNAEALAFAGEPLGRARLEHDATFGPVPAGRAAVRAEGSRIGPASFDGAFRLEAGRLALSDLALAALGARLAGAMELDLGTGLAAGALDLDAPDLAPLAALTGRPAAGAVSGRIDLAAREGAQDATLALRIAGASLPLEAGALAARVLTLDLTLTDALGDPAAAGRIEAEAAEALGYSADRLAFEGRARRLRSPAPEFDGALAVKAARLGPARLASGRIEAKGDLAGFDAKLALRGLETGGSLGDAAVAEAAFEGRIEGAPDELSVAGRLTAAELSGFGARLASLVVEGEAATLLAEPAFDLAAKLGRIEAEGAVVAGGDLTLKGDLGDLTAALKTGRIDAAGLSAASAALDLRARGALSPDPALDARLSLGAADLGFATLAAARATAAGPLSALDLTLSAAGEAEGEPLAFEAAARADLSGPPSATVSRLSARLGAAEAALRAPLRIRSEAGAARLDGIDLALPGGGLTGAAALHAAGASGALVLALADLRPLAALAGLPVEAGALDAAARFDTRAGRAGAEASLSAEGLRFGETFAGAGALGLDATLGWDGRTAALDAALSGPFGDPARMTVALPLRPAGLLPAVPRTGALSGSLDWAGRIGDLWALVPLPSVVLDGDATVALRLAGTVAAPEIGGAVGVTDGRFEHLDAGTILTPLTLTSRIEPGGAFVLDLAAEDGAGNPVTGRAVLSGGRIDATLEAAGAVLVRRDDVTAALTLALAVAGPLDAPAVSGRIGVDRAEVRLVAATPPGVADLGPVRIKGAPPPEPEAPAGARIPLDIAVSGPQDIFVRGRGLDSEWRLDLRVGGTVAEPRIAGDLEKRRGRLDFLGRAFELDRGRVRFSGGAAIDPSLDIALFHENDGVRGGVVVTGTALAPDISFQSRPALPEEEVLPRVLFGRSQQSLTAGEALGLAAGLATLLDGTGGALDRARGAIGLDVLRVEGTSAEDATVTVGSNLASGVFVGAKRPVAGGAGSVVVEIEIFDGLDLESEVGPDVGANLGLEWRRDF